MSSRSVGEGPNDPNARRYGLKAAMDSDLAGEVSKTTINDLNLSEGDIFAYWFDFGDDWWHAIEVEEIKEKAGKGKYPKITNRVGASPPAVRCTSWFRFAPTALILTKSSSKTVAFHLG